MATPPRASSKPPAGAAVLAAESGDGERAEALAQEGVDAARSFGLQTILVMTLTRAAEVAVLLGRWDRAQATLVYCREDNTGTCRIKTLVWEAPVDVINSATAPTEIKLHGKLSAE